MPRFLLTAELQVRANTAAISRARRQIEQGLQGIISRVNLAAAGAQGVAATGVTTPTALKQQGASTIVAAKGQEKLAQSTVKSVKASNQLNTSLHQQTRYLSTSVRDIATLTGGVLTLHAAYIKLQEGIRSAVQFQAQLAGMAQIAGQALKGMSSLGDLITDLSIKYGVAASILAQNSQELLQAGRSITQVRQALPTLALLGTNAQVGADGLQEASKAMIVWGNVFNQTMDETRQSFEKVVKLSKTQYVNAKDLIESTTILASLNKGLNLSFEETISLAAALRSQTGRPINEVSRGLKTLETRIARRPSTIKALESAGVPVYKNGQLRNIIEIISDVEELSNKLGKTSREAQILQNVLFGIRRSEFGSALLEALPQVRKNLSLISGDVDELGRDFTVWSETTQFAANQTAASFRQMFREITTESESFNLFATNVLNATNALFKLIGNIKDLIPLLTVVGGALLAKRFGGSLIGLGAGAAAGLATSGTKSPYGGFYQPGYTTKSPIFFPQAYGTYGDRYGRAARYSGPARNWQQWYARKYLPYQMGYRETQVPGRFTPLRGLRQTSQALAPYKPLFGLGAITAGAALAGAQSPYARAAGTGLGVGGTAALIGATGPQAVFAGLAIGVKSLVDELDKQAKLLGENKINDAADKFSAVLDDLGDKISAYDVSRIGKQLEQLSREGERAAEEAKKGAGTFSDWAVTIGTFGTTNAVAKRQKDLASDVRINFLRQQAARAEQVITKGIEQGLPQEELMKILWIFRKAIGEPMTFLEEMIKNQAISEQAIREKLNNALSSSLGQTTEILGRAIRNLKNAVMPLKDIRSPETFLPTFSGLENPIYTQEFKRSIIESGITQIAPELVKNVDQINSAFDVFRSMLQNPNALQLQSGESIAEQFQQKALQYPTKISDAIIDVFTKGVKKLDWEKIEEAIKTGNIEAVLNDVADQFKLTTGNVKELGDVIKANLHQNITNLQAFFNQLGQERAARLGVGQNIVGIFQQKRQFANLPSVPGLVAQTVDRVVGATAQQLNEQLTSLRNELMNTTDEVRRAQIAVIIGDVTDKLKILADVTSRTSDIMQRLSEVEQSRQSKLGIIEEFFGGDLEQRQKIFKETQAAQLAVRRGSLLNLPNIETQQAAISGLRRFSGVENFLGTGKTGGQLLQQLLERAGGQFVLPENVQMQNLQRQVLQEQTKALAAQIVLAQEEARQSQDFLNQLLQINRQFLEGLPAKIREGITGVQPVVPQGNVGGGVKQGVPITTGSKPIQTQSLQDTKKVVDALKDLGISGPQNVNIPVGKAQILQQQGLGGVGNNLPFFLQPEPQQRIQMGEFWHRGRWVIPLAEQKKRRQSAREADKLEKQALREQDRLLRKFGPALFPNGVQGAERKFQRAIGLRQRAAGLPDIEEPMKKFQEGNDKFNEGVKDFGTFVDGLLTKLREIFGNNNNVNLNQGVMQNIPNVDQFLTGIQDFNNSTEAFNNASQVLSDSLSINAESFNKFGLQLGSSVSIFDNSVNNFTNSIPELDRVITSASEKLKTSISSSIPDSVDVNSQQNISVTINGSDLFNKISEEVVKIANQEIKKQLKEFAKNMNNYGPSLS